MGECQVDKKEIVNKGAKFITTRDLEKICLTHWRAPFTGGFECTIPAGTILISFYDQVEHPATLGLIPENYEEFERSYVSETYRFDPKYQGYSFVFTTNDIGDKLKPID